jgi:hypothetical protein
MDRKSQIFVSSTYDDLRDERNEVIKDCLNIGQMPVGTEVRNSSRLSRALRGLTIALEIQCFEKS